MHTKFFLELHLNSETLIEGNATDNVCLPRCLHGIFSPFSDKEGRPYSGMGNPLLAWKGDIAGNKVKHAKLEYKQQIQQEKKTNALKLNFIVRLGTVL